MGRPEFCNAAAHANGIADKDEGFAALAAKQAHQLARDLSHPEPPAEAWTRTFEIGYRGLTSISPFRGEQLVLTASPDSICA
jgi:hypothetical protein